MGRDLRRVGGWREERKLDPWFLAHEASDYGKNIRQTPMRGQPAKIPDQNSSKLSRSPKREMSGKPSQPGGAGGCRLTNRNVASWMRFWKKKRTSGGGGLRKSKQCGFLLVTIWGWPQNPFRFFLRSDEKNPNEIFGPPYTSLWIGSLWQIYQSDVCHRRNWMQDAWELSLTTFLYIKNDSKIIY